MLGMSANTFVYVCVCVCEGDIFEIYFTYLFSKPTAEMLTEYTRKIDFLKGLIEAEKLVSGTFYI